MTRTRRCAASGETFEEDALIRFALAPDGEIVPDLGARLPGRGVWVKADRASVTQAVKRNAFARSLKCQARPPATLADDVERLLARACLDMLGLGLRARALAIGTVQVEEAIRKAPPHGLIEALDGAADGREKLIRLAFGLWGTEPVVVGCFSAHELGVALGRPPVVHVSLLQESMARRWSVAIGKLAGFRAIYPESWPPPRRSSDA